MSEIPSSWSEAGSISFSGKFDPDIGNWFESSELRTPKAHQLKFCFEEDSIERYWNNLLFRMFSGPPKKKESCLEFSGILEGIDIEEQNGVASLSFRMTTNDTT